MQIDVCPIEAGFSVLRCEPIDVRQTSKDVSADSFVRGIDI